MNMCLNQPPRLDHSFLVKYEKNNMIAQAWMLGSGIRAFLPLKILISSGLAYLLTRMQYMRYYIKLE